MNELRSSRRHCRQQLRGLGGSGYGRVKDCSDRRITAEPLRASGRPWKRRGLCVRNVRGVGATCSSSVRRSRFPRRLCRTSGGCAVETPYRKPARSRCAWPGTGSPAGYVHAGRGHCPPNEPPHSGDDLTGLPTQGKPDPAWVRLATHGSMHDMHRSRSGHHP